MAHDHNHDDKQHRHRHKIGHKHGEGSSIDFHAYASKIRHWNAGFKVAFALTILLLSIILNNPYVSICVILTMGFITVVIGGLPLSEYISVMTIPTAFIFLGTVTIGIDFAWEPVGQYNLYLGFFYVYTSVEKIRQMTFLVLKVFAAVSAMEMMSLSTPASEVIGVLHKAHVPKLITELMNMIYRYIFILMNVYQKMKNSAESRLGYVDFKTSIKSFAGITSNMLVVSLKKGNDYYNALEARCYEGEMVFLEEKRTVSLKQIVFAVVYVGILIAIWGMTKEL